MEKLGVLEREIRDVEGLNRFELEASGLLQYENGACSPFHSVSYAAFRLRVMRYLICGAPAVRTTTLLTQQMSVRGESCATGVMLTLELLLPAVPEDAEEGDCSTALKASKTKVARLK